MSDFRTDEEQAEALKKWWSENGKYIIAGVVIGIGAIFGWRGYNTHLGQQSLEASNLYEQMIIASREDDTENVAAFANQIIENYKSTTYATFATLMLAKQAAENGKYDDAESHLRWVISNASQEEFEHVARLRLARVLIAAEKITDAEKLLATKSVGEFSPRYEELRGDILVKQNKIDEARQAYEKALVNSATESNPILQMKLDDLGRS